MWAETAVALAALAVLWAAVEHAARLRDRRRAHAKPGYSEARRPAALLSELPPTLPTHPMPRPTPTVEEEYGNHPHSPGHLVYERDDGVALISRGHPPTEWISVKRLDYENLLLSTGYIYVGLGDGTWASTRDRDRR